MWEVRVVGNYLLPDETLQRVRDQLAELLSSYLSTRSHHFFAVDEQSMASCHVTIKSTTLTGHFS